VNTVAIAGASGVVGARALHYLLDRDDVDRVIAVGRRTLPQQHPKLISRIADLQGKAAIASEISEQVSVAVCCLGTTIATAGSKEAFRAVDRDAVVAFAEAALDKGAKRFLLVSSIGANARSGNFYLKTKGEAEDGVTRLPYRQLTIVRPSFIDDQGARREYRAKERLTLPLARLVFSIVGKTNRYAPISADQIGRALARLAFDDTTERLRILESDKLHAL
jgi:uncharacterized protein YbjT (DUF2867 family)